MLEEPDTRTTEEVVAQALEGMRRHDVYCESLLVKFFGQGQLDKFRSFPDVWLKKQWYCNRIKELGYWQGLNSARQRRTKSYKSPIFKKCQEVETEYQLAADTLMMELIRL